MTAVLGIAALARIPMAGLDVSFKAQWRHADLAHNRREFSLGASVQFANRITQRAEGIAARRGAVIYWIPAL
jgi:hypothetical protein